MAWVKLDGSEVVFKSKSNTYFEAGCDIPAANGGPVTNHKYGLTTFIEYDETRTTPTQTYIRFRGTHTGGKSYAADSCLVFYNPNNNLDDGTRKLYTIKTYKGKWSTEHTHDIKITKDYSAKTFVIQDYWICNNGSGETADTHNEDIEAAYEHFNGSRKDYVQQITSKAYAIAESSTVATSVGDGTVSIVDNFNNSYTVEGKRGGNGTNNPVVSATLEYSHGDGTTSVNFEDLAEQVSKTITFTPTDASATRSVRAEVTTTGTYNITYKDTTENIKQYVGPNAPTDLKISYTKSRLTLKENWTLGWTKPTTNNGCDIKGYRIRLYRMGSAGVWFPIPIYDSTGSMKHVISDSTKKPPDYYWDKDGTDTSVTIYTEHYVNKIYPGDKVKFTVIAYTKYGKDFDGKATNSDNSPLCFNINGAASSEDYEEYVVQNAGIVRVKVDDEWKEGQVYVKADDAWHEAETVYIKANSVWNESQ